MSQFKIIADTSETLKELLKESFVSAGFKTVTISTDVPKKDNIKNKPAVNCYMYHIGFAPNYKERTQSLVSTQDRDGNIVEFYQDAPLYLFAHYVVSIWGNSPTEENLLMGLAIKTFLENPMVTREKLKGDSFYPDDILNVYPNLQADYNDVLSFWRSLNEEVRPVMYYYVKFRIESERRSAEIRRVTGKDLAIRK
ncbi:MAG: DUF4255 domain-containing protein [Myxococcales bacterium]|nr:DUF4255 domain-containing protein [Myxococcales bacterium]